MLVMWDHGGGWVSQCVDEDAPGVKGMSSLSMMEVRQGIAAGLLRAKLPRFDIVAFDQCLMSQMETARELVGLADVMVASEALVPVYGMPYEAILPLFARPHLGPRRMAARMVEEFTRFFTRIGRRGQPNDFRLWVAKTTFAALDVRQVEAASAALDRLLLALEPALPKHWPTIARCLYYAEGYADRENLLAGEHATASIDLCDALQRIHSQLRPFPAEMEYRAFLQSLDPFVIVSQTGDRRRQSNGVSIYAPVTQKQWNEDYLRTAFARSSRWPGFLRRLHSLAAAERTPPKIEGFRLTRATGPKADTVRPLNESFLHYEVTGNQLCWIKRFVAKREPAGLRILRTSLVVDPEFVLRRRDVAARELDWVMPQFANGRNALRSEIAGAQLGVSNGKDVIIATTYRHKVASAAPIVVHGMQYRDAKDRVGTPVRLEFDPFLWTPTIQGVGLLGSYRRPSSASEFAFRSELHTSKGIVQELGRRIPYRTGLKLALSIDEPGEYLTVLKAATMDLRSVQASHPHRIEVNPELAKLTADWSKFEAKHMVGSFRQLVYTQNLRVEPTGVICHVLADPAMPGVYSVTTNRAVEGRVQKARQIWILDRSGTPSLRILELDAEERVTAIYYGPALLRLNDEQMVLHTKVLNYGGILWLWEKLPSKAGK